MRKMPVPVPVLGPAVAIFILAMSVTNSATNLVAGESIAPLPDALTAGWQGQAVCELLQEDAASRMLLCTFPPGVGHERHYHPPHLGYVLDGGAMLITEADGTRRADLPAGGSWQSDGIAWHEALNVGETTTRYLIVEEKR